MATSRIKALCLALLWICIALPGCVEREEKIVIDKNGAAAVSVVYEADSREELYPGRVPTPEQGWHVREYTETRKDGKIRYRVSADQVFAPETSLPGTFADPGLPDAHLHLHFPTRLWFEARDDGVYCHFRRIYKKRPWAFISALKELKADDETRALMKKDPKTLSATKRETLIRGMTEVELHKKLTFARSAFLAVTSDDQGQDGWLRIYNEVLALQDSLDFKRLTELAGMEDGAGDQALVEIAEAFEENIRRLLQTGVRAYCGLSEAQENAFFKQYQVQERGYNLSEDIDCENFIVSVEMPGEIVGANADRISGNEATWEFNGKALQDRDHELIMSARLTR